jgi:hypothetical protein
MFENGKALAFSKLLKVSNPDVLGNQPAQSGVSNWCIRACLGERAWVRVLGCLCDGDFSCGICYIVESNECQHFSNGSTRLIF